MQASPLSNLHVVIFFFIVSVLSSFITRAAMVAHRVTDDMLYYTAAEAGKQMTRFSFDKSSVFAFLKVASDDPNIRLYILVLVISLAFSLAVTSWLGENSFEKKVFIVLTAGFMVYLAQIDTHLVRQQIGLYIGLFVISGRCKFFLPRMMLIGLSLLFHEITLVLYLSWLISRYTFFGSRLMLLSFVACFLASVYVFMGNPQHYLLIVMLISFCMLFCRFDSSHKHQIRSNAVHLVMIIASIGAVSFSSNPVVLERLAILVAVMFVWVLLTCENIYFLRKIKLNYYVYTLSLFLISTTYALKFFNYV